MFDPGKRRRTCCGLALVPAELQLGVEAAGSLAAGCDALTGLATIGAGTVSPAAPWPRPLPLLHSSQAWPDPPLQTSWLVARSDPTRAYLITKPRKRPANKRQPKEEQPGACPSPRSVSVSAGALPLHFLVFVVKSSSCTFLVATFFSRRLG